MVYFKIQARTVNDSATGYVEYSRETAILIGLFAHHGNVWLWESESHMSEWYMIHKFVHTVAFNSYSSVMFKGPLDKACFKMTN